MVYCTHVAVFIIAEKSVAIVRSPCTDENLTSPLEDARVSIFFFSMLLRDLFCLASVSRLRILWRVSATGSSLSPHRTYRDNGLILRSRNGPVVICLSD